jgi:UDP-N-acetylmuramoylalanine--D-glutamate ligase
MYDLKNKQVLVIGLGTRGRAACELLQRSGANVTAVDSANDEDLRGEAGKLRPLGVEVNLGATALSDRQFNLAVASPAVPSNSPLMQQAVQRKVPIIGELELGYRLSQCLNIAIAGTNGKSTTAELLETILLHNHRKTILTGHRSRPLCAVVEQSKELDFLILQVNSFQLERTQFFRPAVAVLLNLAADHLDRYVSVADYARANARLFANQQPFDWAIAQSEALAQLHALGLALPSKIVTFSANNRRADIYLERGLLISRLAGWAGPLLDMDHCQLQGPHNAENLMAALAVGHVLRLPLDSMVDALKDYAPPAHRCELVAEINGVKFINDSKATNVDALHKALLSVPAGQGGKPNVWLIAGGRDKGLDFHYVGPLLSQRVKQALLIGEAREKIRASWSLFTPCTVLGSLLEAVILAAENAVPGDVVLLSPACSSFDQFRNYQHRGDVFRQLVTQRGNVARVPAQSGTNQTDNDEK